MANKYPSWQDSIIETVRQNFSNMTVDVGAISKAIPKAESKRAMPFVQVLKRSLETGIDASTVFERKLAFDEQEILTGMVPNLKQTVQKCAVLEVILIEEGGKSGKVVGGTEGAVQGEERKELPASAEGAVPGQPTFYFENVQA
jgi:leucyl-tRNA synthetase